ncbi:MAG: putative Ig domain-containing protein, partial [Verrucomicrobia bacterium]|nr:putative Ig domain-containing protein [Verrucomicrobiota bacterium]
MKLIPHLRISLALLAVAASPLSATAALVTVSLTEAWNGTNNPHAADGVTVSGSGSIGDPYVYSIPEGMTITATGLIRLSNSLTDTNDSASITFQFASGNLQIDSGGYIDCGSAYRNAKSKFNLDLGGGSITGAGKIIGIDSVRTPGTNRGVNPRSLTIFNVLNVSLVDIDLHTENINSAPFLSSIAASGTVVIIGTVTTSDVQVSGGGTAGGFSIGASSITVSNINTRALRSDGQSPSGAVTLQALYPLFGIYDPNYFDNSFANQLVIKGGITTDGPRTNAGSGNITLQAVVMRLDPGGSLAKAANGTLTVAAGLSSLGLPTNDLFINIPGTLVQPANSALAPTYTVNWNGTLPSGNAPAFTNSIIVTANAPITNAYSGSISNSATDADSDPLTYLKGSGPAWLTIATNGTLSGTPQLSDSGTNSFRVAVTDGTRYGLATLKIVVYAPPSAPVFVTTPIVKPAATVDADYSLKLQTLADSATDLNFDPMTFAKISGPAWLAIAANGALSGTSAASNIGTNTWTISVSDSSLSSTGTLQIVVGKLVTVSTVEIWNGTNNPHAADGVTLTGSGTAAAPYVYTIPSGLRITGGAAIWLSATMNPVAPITDTNHIKFIFTGGNLQMDSGAWLDVGHPYRNGISTFICDLGGGSLTGAGRILGIDHTRSGVAPASAGVNVRFVTITNAVSVSLTDVDMHVENLNTAPPDFRINATNAVTITGLVDTRYGYLSTDNGHAGNCYISAGAITVNNVDARTINSPTANNGIVTLKALNAAGGWSTSYTNNAYTNQIVVNGAITTAGPKSPAGGNLTLQAVVLRLDTGSSLAKATNGVLTVAEGTTNVSVTASKLFMNVSGTLVGPSSQTLNASNTVTWTGTLAAPYFLTTPIAKPDARAGIDYSLRAQTLANDAVDPQWGTKAFAKVSGPAWLSVASNGALSGTPAGGDAGTNSWSVSMTASSVSVTGTLQIVVVASNAPLAVAGTEDWDGTNNPHAADGVLLAPGSGTAADPAVYTIPGNLTLSA